MSDEPTRRGVKIIIKIVKYFNILLIVLSIIVVLFIGLATMFGSTASSKFPTIGTPLSAAPSKHTPTVPGMLPHPSSVRPLPTD